jgi:hypothetical protein
VLATIALDPALDGQEEIGPHRLRAEIAAPDPAGDRVHQEQGHGGHDQQAGEVVDLLRPELDEEEVESALRQVHQHRLVGGGEPAVPPHEWQRVVDPERDQEQDPFDPAIGPVHALRIDFPARHIGWTVVVVGRCLGCVGDVGWHGSIILSGRHRT